MKLKSQAFNRARWHKIQHLILPSVGWEPSADFGLGHVPALIQLFLVCLLGFKDLVQWRHPFRAITLSALCLICCHPCVDASDTGNFGSCCWMPLWMSWIPNSERRGMPGVLTLASTCVWACSGLIWKVGILLERESMTTASFFRSSSFSERCGRGHRYTLAYLAADTSVS